MTVQPPMAAPLVRQREAITAFLRRVLLGVETLIDDDATVIEPNHPEDVGIKTEAGARHAEQLVHVVELDAKLQMLLDDVFDGDRRRNHDVARPRIISQQRCRITLDLLLAEIRDFLRHQFVILSSASSKPWFTAISLLPSVPAGPAG
jgi:hypothetical protein